jgi:two-component sensor histidine kinase
MDSLDKVGDARSLAQVVIEAIREPLLVLDEDFRILAASDSFHETFQITRSQTFHHPFFTMGDGAWDIPALRQLFGRVFAESNPVDNFEFTHDFPRIGLRTLLLHARRVRFDERNHTTTLLGFEDITGRRVIEFEKECLQAKTDELLNKERMLLEEMQHRIVNSLQIIASILMLKARNVASEETRGHLQDAHRRVISVAEIQKYLQSTAGQEKVELAPYLTKLCASLAASMIDETSNTTLQVECLGGSMPSTDAVSIGLIVTELVINALKYAFPDNKSRALVIVRYEISGNDWKLSVLDNGVGKDPNKIAQPRGGLGTSLVAALAQQLRARVEIESSASGMSISITHAVLAEAAKLRSLPERARA